jgi:hypothetical protein
MSGRKKVLLDILAPFAVGLLVVLSPAGRFWAMRVGVDPVAVHDHIRPGDTEQQVQALFGLPPGNYCTDPDVCPPPEDVCGNWEAIKRQMAHERTWAFNRYEVVIELNDDGIVVDKAIHPMFTFRKPLHEEGWDRVRDLFPFWLFVKP